MLAVFCTQHPKVLESDSKTHLKSRLSVQFKYIQSSVGAIVKAPTCAVLQCVRFYQGSPRDITERPRAPSGVAAFMSADSKTPCSTPSMNFSSGNGVVRGRRGHHLGFTRAARHAAMVTGPAKVARDTGSIYVAPYNAYGATHQHWDNVCSTIQRVWCNTSTLGQCV